MPRSYQHVSNQQETLEHRRDNQQETLEHRRRLDFLSSIFQRIGDLSLSWGRCGLHWRIRGGLNKGCGGGQVRASLETLRVDSDPDVQHFARAALLIVP